MRGPEFGVGVFTNSKLDGLTCSDTIFRYIKYVARSRLLADTGGRFCQWRSCEMSRKPTPHADYRAATGQEPARGSNAHFRKSSPDIWAAQSLALRAIANFSRHWGESS